ncbi:MAG TPA: hypothetical protein VH593_25025, partial [Ktedonobacteraceae bacterium]
WPKTRASNSRSPSRSFAPNQAPIPTRPEARRQRGFSADGVWAYQFSDAQKQTLAQLIAGKNVQAAQQALDAQPGVERATIQLFGGQTLPSDPAKITIVVQVAR